MPLAASKAIYHSSKIKQENIDKGDIKHYMAKLLDKNQNHKGSPHIFMETIDIEDFNTEHPNTRRLKKLFNTFEFSEQNKEMEKYKGMTMDDLRMNKIISNTDGKPSPSLTDEKWQKEFNIRKMFLKICQGNDGRHNHCAYINDVLKNICDGQVDYCYFIYQIMELAKVYPVALRTRYRDGYWEVWLSR